MKKIVVVGAGFGGLSAAAELSRLGFEVTVLEAHIYPGGSAGTFYHQGYKFDAGATLAGGFAPGAVMDQLGRHFGIDWQAEMASEAMLVHLPDGSTVTRWTDPERWRTERIDQFGLEAEPFWEWQEKTADAMWNLALRFPHWPPQSVTDVIDLSGKGFTWLQEMIRNRRLNQIVSMVPDAIRPAKVHLPKSLDKLRQFIDAQLLISAQTTSGYANALYSAAALDLARQGIGHVPGGMGGMADKLVAVVKRNGGEVKFRQEVVRVSNELDGVFSVETKQGEIYQADVVIFNIPPWNIAGMFKRDLPPRLRRLPEKLRHAWGAFMLYVGIDNYYLPVDFPLHYQVIDKEPLGEGHSIFMSVSPAWDGGRAPAGKRAFTFSTHTRLDPWWDLKNGDRAAYDERKDQYTERLLMVAEKILPDIRKAADLLLPGTPVTFERFTRRAWGWVGGFPQTNLFSSWGSRLGPGLWMVGDSVFPGQSVPAVMLSGLRTARMVAVKEAQKANTKKEWLICHSESGLV
jgi:C-3',4' desaturase CrtD